MDISKMSAEECQAAIDKLEKENFDQAVKIESLEAAHAGCEEKIATLTKVIASAKTGNAGIPGTPADPIDFEGKRYLWLKPSFQFAGSPKVMAAAATPEDIKALLATAGQKVIKELA